MRLGITRTQEVGKSDMFPLPQQNKSIPGPSKRLRQRWTAFRIRLDVLTIGAILTLGVSVLLLATTTGWLQVTGGALFAGSIGLISSLWTGRAAVHQQFAKDANVQRKIEVYGPLHAELKKLREWLEDASKGKQPYPKWIDGAGDEPAFSKYGHNYLVPTFRLWPEFKGDYRIDNFTESARKILDEAQHRAATYNVAVAATEKPSQDLLTPHIASAFESIRKTPDFQEWDQKYRTTGGQQYGWFQRVDSASSFVTPDSPFGQAVAMVWLDNFGARGWLIADRIDQAARSVYENYKRQGDVIPPDPSWFQTILQMMWTDIDNHPTYQETRSGLAAHLVSRFVKRRSYYKMVYITFVIIMKEACHLCKTRYVRNCPLWKRSDSLCQCHCRDM
jgi:hypothetical protein